jgi:hypothetical protein
MKNERKRAERARRMPEVNSTDSSNGPRGEHSTPHERTCHNGRVCPKLASRSNHFYAVAMPCEQLNV